MATPGVLARLYCLTRHAEDRILLPMCMGKHLSTLALKTLSSPAVSKIPVFSMSSVARIASESEVSEKDRLKALADLRRKYERQTSDLRKKYAADIKAKTLEKKKIEVEQRKQIEEQKAARAAQKKQRAAARAIEVAEEEKALQAVLKEERAESASQRARMEGKQGYIRFKRMEEIRRQSSMWIEEKNLERRILEAIANPYHLSGSSPMEASDRDDSYYEDPEEV